jgi:hypothetical protein
MYAQSRDYRLEQSVKISVTYRSPDFPVHDKSRYGQAGVVPEVALHGLV